MPRFFLKLFSIAHKFLLMPNKLIINLFFAAAIEADLLSKNALGETLNASRFR